MNPFSPAGGENVNLTAPMNAAPILIRVARVLRETGLEAVMIGNAAAALQGAPVTTVDVDFLFRKTPANLRKLKKVAVKLGAVIFKPYYPPRDFLRLYADDDEVQLNFLTERGGRSYVSVRTVAVQVAGEKLMVERLSRKLIGRVRPSSSKKGRPSRSEKLEALKLESELALDDQIRRLLAKPPAQRTHFLRKRIGIGSTCL